MSGSRRGKIRLDLTENTRGCSKKVIDAIKNITHEDLSIYPEYEELINKLANHLKVEPAEILIANGGDEAIKCITDAYLDEGDEVIMPVPTFSTFSICCKFRKAKVVEILYNHDFSFPLDQVLDSISKQTKMVILINPHNPLGSCVGEEDIIKVLNKAKNSMVVLDETYSHYFGGTYIGLIEEFSNILIVQTFSKAFGLAGIRLGYVISAKENIEDLKEVRLPYSINSLAVIAGCAALEDMDYIERVIKEVEEEKENLYREFKRLEIEVFGTHANFLLLNMGKRCDFICEKLKEQNILVKNLSNYPLLSGFLRITIGTKEENGKVVKALEDKILVEAILFDLDGVLIDVSCSYRMAIKKTAEYFLQKEISLSEIQKYKERGGYNNDWELTETLISEHGGKVPEEKVIDKFQKYYLGEDFNGLVRNEKLMIELDILKSLKKDYKLGIVTGRPKREAEYALKKFNLSNFFDVLVDMEDVAKDKPAPQGLKLSMKKLNVKRAMYVGDTIDDIRAAIDAHVIPVGVASEGSERVFREAKYILRSVNAILDIL